MSVTLKDQITVDLNNLLPQIKKVVAYINKAEEDWPNHYDRTDPDDLYLRSMFVQAGDKLDDAVRILKRAFAEPEEVGVLRKQGNGRYALGNREFTSVELKLNNWRDDHSRKESGQALKMWERINNESGWYRDSSDAKGWLIK